MPNPAVEIVMERPLSRILGEHIAGSLLSFLPADWRRWWTSEVSDAVLSGAVEAGVATYYFLQFTLHAIDRGIGGLGRHATDIIGQSAGDGGIMALGPFIVLGLLLKPLTLALAISAFDGYVRAATALISGDVQGTVWLALPHRAFRALRNRWQARTPATART